MLMGQWFNFFIKVIQIIVQLSILYMTAKREYIGIIHFFHVNAWFTSHHCTKEASASVNTPVAVTGPSAQSSRFAYEQVLVQEDLVWHNA